VLLGSSVAGQSVKPNFLFIMTDDISKWMLKHMPITSGRIGGQGLTFENFYGAQPEPRHLPDRPLSSQPQGGEQ
jgi:hypothetical protein